MLGLDWSDLLKGLVAILCVLGVISLALIYFFPAPPSTISMGVGFKGGSYELLAARYQEILARSYGKPTYYACLCRDEVALHLLASHETKRLPGNGGICVFVKDVDGIHAEFAARGAKVIKPPQNYDYGMRDLDVVDLDGNHLTFGMESRSSG